MAKKKFTSLWEFNGVKINIDFTDKAKYQAILDGFRDMSNEQRGDSMPARYRAFFDNAIGVGYGEKLIPEDDSLQALDCLASFLDYAFDKMLKVPELMHRMKSVTAKKDMVMTAIGELTEVMEDEPAS